MTEVLFDQKQDTNLGENQNSDPFDFYKEA